MQYRKKDKVPTEMKTFIQNTLKGKVAGRNDKTVSLKGRQKQVKGQDQDKKIPSIPKPKAPRQGTKLPKPHRPHRSCANATSPTTLAKRCLTLVLYAQSSPDVLLATLERYLRYKRIHQVVVLWTDRTFKPPDFQRTLGTRTRITVKRVTGNRITDKYSQHKGVHTSALLSLNDDLIVSEVDINRAFKVWKKKPNRLVGFDPTSHKLKVTGRGYIYEYCCKDEYSMVAGDAVIYHKGYNAHFQKSPKKMLAFINRMGGCEDIAMNLVVSEHCGKTGAIYVPPKVPLKLSVDKVAGRKTRTNQRPNLNRNACLSALLRYYSRMPLKMTRKKKINVCFYPFNTRFAIRYV